MAVTLRNQHGTRFGHGQHLQYMVSPSTSGYALSCRELITTATVRHALGQPVLYTDYVGTLREARVLIADIEAATNAAGAVRYSAFEAARRTNRDRISAECERICAEYDAMVAAR